MIRHSLVAVRSFSQFGTALAVALVVGLAFAPAAQAAQGDMISVGDVPEKVKAVAEGMAGKLEWIIAFDFAKTGKPCFRIVGKDKASHNVLVDVTAAETPIDVRTCVDYQEVPQAARDAIKAFLPDFVPNNDGGTDIQAIGANINQVAYYHVGGKVGDKTTQILLVSPEGAQVLATADDSLADEYQPPDKAAGGGFAKNLSNIAGTDNGGWVKFSPKDGSCSVLFPHASSEQAADEKSGTYAWGATVLRGVGSSEYQMLYKDLDPKNQFYNKPAKEVLESFAAALNSGPAPKSKREYQLNNYPALECVWDDDATRAAVDIVSSRDAIKFFSERGGSKLKKLCTSRLCVVKHRVYGVSVWNYGLADTKASCALTSDDTKKFLDSFVLAK